MGKTVLFVSEKSAALEVVKRRLDQQRLGDFCLECHSHKSNKKQVIDELGRCLDLPAETYKDYSDDLNRLFETRESLNAYARDLHEVRQPLGLSAFQVHGRLAAIHTGWSITIQGPGRVEDDWRSTAEDPANCWTPCRTVADVIQNHAAHPWRGTRKQKTL